MTPLHYAAGKGHSSVVEVLIRSHADINAVTEVSQCIHNYANTAHIHNTMDHLCNYVCIIQFK